MAKGICYHQDVSEKGPVRVRFAPSPTGHLHVGNARTALFNWLFARQQGGTMILRIEDTDVERSERVHERQIIEDLRWLGIDWDEGIDIDASGQEIERGSYGPYRQSDRTKIYQEHGERLLREGKAYLCFCTNEELEAERQKAIAEHRPQIYSGRCRKLDPAESLKHRAAGEQAAIRLHIPEHPIRFHDIVHGPVEFQSEVVSDPIIIRSSGMPVYNYVVVIDDALMKITHVIRGDDHLSNTPKQVALYEALGWPIPEFAHLSTILGPDRERLSKRHGATSVANFREMGVLPEALVNYMALLGWAPSGGDREIFSPQELVKEFRLERVTPSPAVFDFEKLYWLNRHYLQERISTFTPEMLHKIANLAELTANHPQVGHFVYVWTEFVRRGWLPSLTDKSEQPRLWLSQILRMLGPSDRLEQLPDRAAFIFNYDAKSALAAPDNSEVLNSPKTPAVIEAFAKRAPKDAPLTAEQFRAIVNEVKTETGAKGKELFHPIRIVVTGSHSGPEFDKLIPILEEGSRLQLPKRVLSVRERVDAFLAAR
jgi:nondiscriminating glutamyl-tRNA synthetase